MKIFSNLPKATPEEILQEMIKAGTFVCTGPGQYKIREPEYKVVDYISLIPSEPPPAETKEQFKRFSDLSKLYPGMIFITPKALT